MDMSVKYIQTHTNMYLSGLAVVLLLWFSGQSRSPGPTGPRAGWGDAAALTFSSALLPTHSPPSAQQQEMFSFPKNCIFMCHLFQLLVLVVLIFINENTRTSPCTITYCAGSNVKW